MSRLIIFADGDVDFWKFWTSPGSTVGELGVVFGIVILFALIAFAWAAFWRKPRKRRHAYHHNPAVTADGSPTGLPRRRRRPKLLRILRRQRRRRRHRRRGRPVNPTLADIVGLPPARHEPPTAS